MEDKIYIFGHKNPDTDSVCSAISLSYLENILGNNTEPRILSRINDETKYVLNKFKIQIPEILNDVKLQVSDVNYHKGFKVNIDNTFLDAYYLMKDAGITTIPIVDNDDTFLGALTMTDIVNNFNSFNELSTTYDQVLKILNGKEINKVNNTIKGIILEDIIITDNIESVSNLKKELVIISTNKKVELIKDTNIIYTKLKCNEIINKLTMSQLIKDYDYHNNYLCINDTLDIEDLNDLIKQTRHNYYPVIDNHNKCLGLLKLSDLKEVKPKKVILVDHNELSQSVDGIEEAKIISIVDHHKLGTLGTMEPVNFRNMILGSTCTIIYKLYKENKVKIPNHIASLLLSGIISDTLLLKSPTTTKDDQLAFNDLVKISNINPERLAIEMFKANDMVKSKSIKDIIYTDFKTFPIDKKIIAIAQVTTLNAKAIIKQKQSYINFLNKESKDKNYDVIILCITDIFKNGSYLLFNDSSKEKLLFAFDGKLEQGDFIPELISRKKQLLPKIINSFL